MFVSPQIDRIISSPGPKMKSFGRWNVIKKLDIPIKIIITEKR